MGKLQQAKLLKYLSKPENFMYLNGKNVIYPCVANIVWKYIKENEENFDKLKKKFIENKKISVSLF